MNSDYEDLIDDGFDYEDLDSEVGDAYEDEFDMESEDAYDFEDDDEDEFDGLEDYLDEEDVDELSAMEDMMEGAIVATNKAEQDSFLGAIASIASKVLPTVLPIAKRVLPRLVKTGKRFIKKWHMVVLGDSVSISYAHRLFCLQLFYLLMPIYISISTAKALCILPTYPRLLIINSILKKSMQGL